MDGKLPVSVRGYKWTARVEVVKIVCGVQKWRTVLGVEVEAM